MCQVTHVSIVLFSTKSELLEKEGETASMWEALGAFCAACRIAWTGHRSRAIQQLLLPPLTRQQR